MKAIEFRSAEKGRDGMYEDAGPFYCLVDEIVGLGSERNHYHTFRAPQELTRIYLSGQDPVLVMGECQRIKEQIDRFANREAKP
jgi:hypothetical protein